MNNNISDLSKLISMIVRFKEFVKSQDEGIPFSFVDENTFLGREENYKSKIAERARNELDYGKWKESWIGNGKILNVCGRAMAKAQNLVNRNQQTLFKNMINPNHERYKPDAERALYDIYKSRQGAQEATAFAQAKKVFGGYYDTIAYLFFIKDESRFIPISPGNFEKSLYDIGINYELSGKCDWDNYTGFIDIVKDVQSVMQDNMPDVDIRLIDAHSFLWVINEKCFREWNPDTETKADIEYSVEKQFGNYQAYGNAVKRSRTSSYISRSAEVVRITKARANGVCQLCGLPAPFKDKNGEPYLESHHIIWLSRGGEDSTSNTVALCPNCHTKMHVVDSEDDIKMLKNQK